MIGKPGIIVALAVGLVSSNPAAHAQTQTASQGPPNALQGFSQNRDQPVHIEAATLEVRDKQKQATFSGDVRVKQGDTGLRCKSLVVFYEQSGEPTDSDKTLQAAKPGPGGEQRIKRLEARGSVVVTQKDQTATGELGIFDMKTNTVTLTGNPVVMTQGQNILRGGKLVVDLTSGVSRVEAGKSGQGVQMLVQPGGAVPDSKGGNGNGHAPRPIPVRPFN
ncbi:MAG TPA: LptA/OstA family protein [Pseudolabrys sp.]|nr:LptA/OstA family protein [Pseudolabrys sp.]